MLTGDGHSVLVARHPVCADNDTRKQARTTPYPDPLLRFNEPSVSWVVKGLRMERVVVMGPPGSGKSTMARTLGARFALPVFHLDQIYWRPGWIEAPAEVFGAEVERIAGLPAWVIDGNYTDTIAARLRAADTVIYLDVPSWLFMPRIAWRILTNYGRVRADAAPGCPEWLDWVFLRFAWSWNRTQRGRNLALVESFPGRKVILRSRVDRHRFCAGLRRGAAPSIIELRKSNSR